MISSSSQQKTLNGQINNSFDILAYKVMAGETVSDILTKHYNTAIGSSDYQRALLSLQYINPEISNIDTIFPGQIIRLMPLAPDKSMAYCPAPATNKPETVDKETLYQFLRDNPPKVTDLVRYQQHWPTTTQEQEAFWALALLEENYGILSTTAAAGFGSFDGIVSTAHRDLAAEVKSLWDQYQKGAITQNQYNYRRQNALKKFSQKLGPFEKLLLKGKTSREAFRIARSKAVPATAKIDRQLNRLSSMAKLSKHGGILLAGANLGVSCYQISNTQNRQKKNEIFVESIISTATGAVATMAISVLLISNPVGWGVALVLGASSALASYTAGKSAANFYSKSGRQLDLVKSFNVDNIC